MSDKSANLILRINDPNPRNDLYLVQERQLSRHPIIIDSEGHIEKGRDYSSVSFIWPGAYSIFGGHIKDGETVEQAFEREIGDELRNLDLKKLNIEREITYKWSRDLRNVLSKANKYFNGNIESFLGFDFNSRIPSCAYGRYRNQVIIPTFYEWVIEREDYYVIATVDKKPEIKVSEGEQGTWVPSHLCRALSMVPVDKLALLDDMAGRIAKSLLDWKETETI